MDFAYSSPESQGLSSTVLQEMIEEISQKAELHSLGILKNGAVIASHCWAPFTNDVPQMMHSLSKLFTSICVGFAVDEGRLGLDDCFLNYIREDVPEEYDKCLEQVTIRYLLTMRAGSAVFANNVYFTKLSDNWQTHWLTEKRIAEDIGQVHHYDSGCSYTLSHIVTVVMGKTCLELMQERVFDKLGLPKINWLQSPQGYNTGGWGAYMTAEYLMRVGQLLVQNGQWNGEQLIPSWWINEMRSKQVGMPKPGPEKIPALDSYGYHIMTGTDIYAACGAFGNYLFCFRDQPLVVAITAGTKCEEIPDILVKYLAKTEHSVEGNNDALKSYLKTLSIPFPDGDAAAKKEKELFGKVFALNANPRDIRTIKIERLDDTTVEIKADIAGEEKVLKAGYRNWVCNDVYPGDFSKRYHSMSYAWNGNDFCVDVCLLNTSYYEKYTLQYEESKLKCSWTPNVTYLDGGDISPRNFVGKET